MTLTELSYIVALAQEQHFGRAAERCHVSQPTLSIAVKKLEDELDVTLFERCKNGVQITPLGERIVAMAGGVLHQTAAIKDVAAADKDQLRGPLALGTLPTIGPYLLPQFIPLLQKTAGQLSLYVEEGSQDSLTSKLRNGELDVILVTSPFSEPDVVAQTLFDEPFVLLLPADHRLANKTVIAAADLDPAEVLLLGEGDRFRDQVLAAFPGLSPQHASGATAARNFTRGSTLEALRHMVASKLGLTILPQTAAEAPLYASDVLVTRPFASPAPKRTLILAWRVSFPRHKAIDVLRRTIQASSSAFWNYNSARCQDTPGVLVENRNW
ncbi:MAG TPA: hydrogen peroxide-inducible genes activator [Steroidobacteraceae bacterium]|jgi:LysR family hydrogen peroxide-inducible transcriptional activator|nr:hydrogen peroxide-inducible genes activator [Steroidobacteraceae bacterium]